MHLRFLFLWLLCSAFQTPAPIVFQTETCRIALDASGRLTEWTDLDSQTNYLAQEQASWLLSLMIRDSLYRPVGAQYQKAKKTLTLRFPEGRTAEIRVKEQASHLSFELLKVSNDQEVALAVWGPYGVTLKESIGETVGIAQNATFTAGIQALNPKTLGGYPWKDNDHLPQIDVFEQEDYEDLQEGKRWVLYSVEAAKPTRFGATLQAYVRNRREDRVIENWGHQRYVAPALNDGGLKGSAIALFGCPSGKTLETIGAIELAEGLPHPTINGEWIKTSPIANTSYLIMDFDESNVDQCLDYAERAGMHYLYHGSPFKTWGHYELSPLFFPNSKAGLKACVQKAEKRGISLGTHTLSNFINTEDAYVSPVPDKRLAKTGSSVLSQAIYATQKDIPVDQPDFFNQMDNNTLHGVQIGEEIIRYGRVSEQAPWMLLDCERGAFGTRATAHAKGATAFKLTDHAYQVFLGDAALNKEIAENVADLFNETGVRMLDFDGLEGAHSTGLGNYGEALFAQAWYDRLNSDLKSHFVLGASRSGHYFWHLYSRMNWGEPWYAGFRESQTEYRMLNQKYFKRNLMPGMLGWFKFTAGTTLEDIEWLMTRSAAYNAGFCLVMDLPAAEGNGMCNKLLETIRLWESARLKGQFPVRVCERMKDLSTEFRLEKGADGQLYLTEIFSHKFKHVSKVRQPGEPLFSTFEVKSPMPQALTELIVTANGADLTNLKWEINRSKQMRMNVTLKKGYTLKYTGGQEARVYDAQWHLLETIPVLDGPLVLPAGSNTVLFDARFANPDPGVEPFAQVEIRVLDVERRL
ncbi:MAG: hypothetical protein JNN28_15970 [Saprospiraceae bacterium]|nr:hypothetical protein [Saprospiraceae bacterium]